MFCEVNSPNSQVQIGIADADRTWELEDRIKILEAQLESLELELCCKIQELEKMEQLRYTNQELCAAINPKQLTLEQAEELARNFLKTEKPLKDALVELLSAMYNASVDLDNLDQAPWWDEIELASSQPERCRKLLLEKRSYPLLNPFF